MLSVEEGYVIKKQRLAFTFIFPSTIETFLSLIKCISSIKETNKFKRSDLHFELGVYEKNQQSRKECINFKLDQPLNT